MIYVKGKITDKGGNPIDNANITITNQDGSNKLVNGYVIGRTSDNKGNFTIPVALADSFVTFSYVGYKPLTLPAESAKNKSVFKLLEDSNTLQDVTITTSTHAPARPASGGIRPKVTPTPEVQPKKSYKKYYLIAGTIVGVALIGLFIYHLVKK